MTIESDPSTPESTVSNGPLAGIRVLEFSQIVAGPVAGLALADLGADVVKVEPPGGEARRRANAVVPNESKYFQSLNRGKRSLVIDLRNPAGAELVRRIIPRFDAVISNYRAGVTVRLGVDYRTLSAINPALVYLNITGFGPAGPKRQDAASDIIAQAYSGLMAAEGRTEEDGVPSPLRASTFVDRYTGIAAAMGICAALLHAQRTGEGQELNVSLLQSALDLQSDRVMREPVEDATLRDPFIAEIQQRRESGAPYDQLLEVRERQQSTRTAYKLYYSAYHTAKGTLVLGAQTKRNRDAMRALLGVSDTTDTPDFDNAAPEASGQLRGWRAEVQAALMARTAAEWVPLLLEAGAAATIVQFPEELADDPQVVAAGMTRQLMHEVTGAQTVVGPLVTMSRTPTGHPRPAPALGFHTVSVLEELGLTEREINEMLDGGAVHLHPDQMTARESASQGGPHGFA